MEEKIALYKKIDGSQSAIFGVASFVTPLLFS